MELTYLARGSTPGLGEVLSDREKRVQLIEDMKADAPEATVLCFKLNIPGPVKSNPVIEKVFVHGQNEIDKALEDKGATVFYYQEIYKRTGPELYVSCEWPARELKEKMVALEEESPLGRLYDIDVEDASGAISRSSIGKEERQCFICDQPARVCGRSRAHSVEEMLVWVEELLEENKDAWQDLEKKVYED